jgi:hypothetical protein
MWSYFNIHIITIPTSNFTRIKQKMYEAGITNYKIHTFEPAKKQANTGLDRLGLLDIMSHDHCDSTSRNITKNHVNVIKYAFSQKLKHVLIMEDDVEIKTTPTKLNRIIDWVENNDWDILYFGHCPWPVMFSTFRTIDIVKVISPLLGHCYLLSYRGMSKVINIYRKLKSIQLEKLLIASNLNSFAIFTSIAHQIEAPGLYRKAMEKLGMNIPHNTLFTVCEYIAVLIPIITVVVLVCIIIYIKKK